MPCPSNVVNQLDNSADRGGTKSDLRILEVSTGTGTFGRLWFGQRAMASDGTTEVDLSGTMVISYSSVAETAGGQFFRTDAGALSGVRVGFVVSNLDGPGRQMRIRYDTPELNGFTFRTSSVKDLFNHEDGSLYDIAATYAGAFQDVEVAARLRARRRDRHRHPVRIGFGAAQSLRHQPDPRLLCRV